MSSTEGATDERTVQSYEALDMAGHALEWMTEWLATTLPGKTQAQRAWFIDSQEDCVAARGPLIRTTCAAPIASGPIPSFRTLTLGFAAPETVTRWWLRSRCRHCRWPDPRLPE